jgi:hypothetical protein
MNTFDERELKDQFLCMSAKYLIFDEKHTNQLSFQQANSIYDNMRAHLREIGDGDIADQKYFINSGRKAVFNAANDRSIASMDSTYE